MCTSCVALRRAQIAGPACVRSFRRGHLHAACISQQKSLVLSPDHSQTRSTPLSLLLQSTTVTGHSHAPSIFAMPPEKRKVPSPPSSRTRSSKKPRLSAAAATAADLPLRPSAEQSDEEKDDAAALWDSDSTVSDESAFPPASHRSSPSPSLSSSSPPSSSPAAPSNSNSRWIDGTPFDPTHQLFKSALPIFRQVDIRQYDPVPTKTAVELDQRTFTEWLDYTLRLPDTHGKRIKNLYTDQQYIDLLAQCTGSQRVSEQMSERSQADKQWLYNQVKNGTYRRVDESYRVSADRVDTGPVLVTFVEPTDGKSEAFRRRHPSARDVLTLGMMRRCVPVSQLQAAIELCHASVVGTGHVGQDNTYINCSRMFDGVPRSLVREYVRRCGICQTKQPRKHKERLTPLVSKQQWERVVMDLVDYGPSRISRGMRYMWHCQDHFSKFNFSAAIPDKTAAEVGYQVEMMLRITGPIKVLQCDNGGEFMGRVNLLCDEWGMDRPTNSAPYRPSTNGLVERSGDTLQKALAKWMEQEQTNEWVDGLSRVTYQVNCTVSKATKRTPHEIVFGYRPRWDSVPIPHTLDLITMLAVIEDEQSPAATTALLPPADAASFDPSPPTNLAASALLDICERSGPTSDDDSIEESIRRTLEVPGRTPEVLLSRRHVHPSILDPSTDESGVMDERGAENPMTQELTDSFDTSEEAHRYLDDDDVHDLDPQRIGYITKRMGEVLDCGPNKFFRRGTYGGGRCLLSAWRGAEDCGMG